VPGRYKFVGMPRRKRSVSGEESASVMCAESTHSWLIGLAVIYKIYLYYPTPYHKIQKYLLSISDSRYFNTIFFYITKFT